MNNDKKSENSFMYKKVILEKSSVELINVKQTFIEKCLDTC